MFIRWQQRGNKKVLYAYVCSGERIEGKVKSRTLGYLGSIAIDAIERKSAREEFWYQANGNLEQLGEKLSLAEEQVQKLKEAIANKIPPN